jgi:cAMP-dependent protein kinase regulator
MTRKATVTKKESNGNKQAVSSEEEDDEEVEDLPQQKKNSLNKKNQRSSVSAEVYGDFNKKGDFKARVIPKSDEQKKRIKERLSKSFMFQALDEKESEIVINAMEEKKFK